MSNSPKEQHADWCNYRHGRCDCGATDQKQAALTSNERAWDILRKARLIRYEHGGGRFAVIDDRREHQQRELVADFYNEDTRELIFKLIQDAIGAPETQPVASNLHVDTLLLEEIGDCILRLTPEAEERFVGLGVGSLRALQRMVQSKLDASRARRSAVETAGNDARDAARYRVVRVSRLTGETLAHELDAACDKIVAARSAVEPKRNQANSTSSGLLAATPTPRGNLPNSLGTGGAGSHPAASSSEKAEAPPSDKCEHGIPRQFCTAVHAEKTEASLPPCECLLIAKEPSAYHALKCPRFVADKL